MLKRQILIRDIPEPLYDSLFDFSPVITKTVAGPFPFTFIDPLAGIGHGFKDESQENSTTLEVYDVN